MFSEASLNIVLQILFPPLRFAQGEENEELYSLNQVYQRTPAALEFLFDKSIRMDWDQSNENRIVVVTDLRYTKWNG